MASTLYKYFKPCRKVTCNMPLPNPEGPLSKEIDTETIKELNKEVEALVNSGRMGKRSPYLKVTAEQRATIGKYASEHDIINAIRHFLPDFPEGALKESTVRGWKKAYLSEIQSRRRLAKTYQLPNYQLKS